MDTSHRPNKAVAAWVVVALVTVAIVSRVWVEVASHYVPEPYLVCKPHSVAATSQNYTHNSL